MKKIILLMILNIIFLGCTPAGRDPEFIHEIFPQIWFKNSCKYKIIVKTYYRPKGKSELKIYNLPVYLENGEEKIIMDWDYPEKIEFYRVINDEEKLIYTHISDGKGENIQYFSETDKEKTIYKYKFEEGITDDVKYNRNNIPLDKYSFLWLEGKSDEKLDNLRYAGKKYSLTQNMDNEIWK